MKSPLICLLPVRAFALYPLERARTISIGSFVESFASSARGGGETPQEAQESLASTGEGDA
jgi:hypothetical protein